MEIDFSAYHVAYFSMEIGIDPEIPTYSGGLGVLAGDTLRSAADLEVGMIGLTLLYKKGYFKQQIDEHGNQVEQEVSWNPEDHLTPFDVSAEIEIEGRRVRIKPWMHKVKGITGWTNPILFLDCDIEGNDPKDRELTHHLYGRDDGYRLAQEMILGIGGVRILQALGASRLRKYHMNEGHSALLAIELCRQGGSIDEVRKRCVFTTHTPVPAGHDQFDAAMAEQMIGPYLTDELRHEVYIGAKLNMTYLGLRLSEYVNGVAKQHGEVSRSMFPGYHIESITNGVHSDYWTAPPIQRLFDRYLPCWRTDPFSLRYILSIPKEELWDAHQEAKQELLGTLQREMGIEMRPEIFTIGFGRRAATYKRGDILFEDTERLKRICERSRGLQIIYAGKAHPKDGEGKALIQRIIQQMRAVNEHITLCYIPDYDIGVAKQLVAGCDLWLNTPMRPLEASGTSGMKAAHNGVPHFSTLDGWWVEGHIEGVTGWSIGRHPSNGPEADHAEEVEDLYTKLEYVILPKFYNERDEWLEVMRHAIAINGSFFNTHRMVQQYVLNAYYD